MVRILHINSSFGKAGAALSMEQLSTALNATPDIQSDMLVGKIYGFRKGGVKSLGKYFEYYVNAIITRLLGIDSVWYLVDHSAKLREILSQYDIIHLHNLHGYYFQIKYLDLFKDKKIVWSIRDYWPLTGKCSFPLGCNKWKTGCGKCPHLDYYPKTLFLDLTTLNFRLKRKAINHLDNLFLVAVSHSVSNVIKKSGLQFKGLDVIYNGLDSNLYRPVYEFDIIKDPKLKKKRKILILASKIVKRKGVDVLAEALSLMPQENKNKYHIIIIGNINKALLKKIFNGFSYTHLGYIYDNNLLTSAYSCADLFINVSLSETFGRTTIESMLCGTPVIAFKYDIMEEIIGDNNLLILINNNKGRNLWLKIEEFFEKFVRLPQYSKENVRKRALKFSFDEMLDNYIKLYQRILTSC